MDERTHAEPDRALQADLTLVLAESDRENPYLAPMRRGDESAADEALDGQILAGLVTP